MARKLCMKFAGAINHVLNRGDRRDGLFKDNPACERFLVVLRKFSSKWADRFQIFPLRFSGNRAWLGTDALIIGIHQANTFCLLGYLLSSAPHFSQKFSVRIYPDPGAARSSRPANPENSGYIRMVCHIGTGGLNSAEN
jgi:hypothetical protein